MGAAHAAEKAKAAVEDEEDESDGDKGNAQGDALASSSSQAAKAAPQDNVKYVSKDSMQELELNLQKDVDQLVKMVMPKVKNATAKKAASKFVTDSLNGLQVKLTLAEAESLHKN